MTFRQPKILKSESPDKNAFTEHFFHDPFPAINYHNKEYLTFISIDPGITRFALRVERRYQSAKLPIVTELQIATTFKHFITDDNGESKLYSEISKFLDKILDLINQSDFIIIERQVEWNYQMVRMSQHMITYFQFRLKNNYMRTRIIEQSSKVKTKALGAPGGMGKKQLKEWAYFVALQLIEARRDEYCKEFFKKLKKKLDKYDPADTIVQLEAFCVYNGFRKTEIVIRHPSFEKFYDLESGKKVDIDQYNSFVNETETENIVWNTLLPNSGFSKSEMNNCNNWSFDFGDVDNSNNSNIGNGFNNLNNSKNQVEPNSNIGNGFNNLNNSKNQAEPNFNIGNGFNNSNINLNNSNIDNGFNNSKNQTESNSKIYSTQFNFSDNNSNLSFGSNTSNEISVNSSDSSFPLPIFNFDTGQDLEPNYSEHRSLNRSSSGLFKYRPPVLDKTKPGFSVKNISPPRKRPNSIPDSISNFKEVESFGNGAYQDGKFLNLDTIICISNNKEPIFNIV